MEISGMTKGDKIKTIDEIVHKLPVMTQIPANPCKSCESCAHLGDTCFKLNIFWPRHRCKECDGYSNWDHITILKTQIEKGINHNVNS